MEFGTQGLGRGVWGGGVEVGGVGCRVWGSEFEEVFEASGSEFRVSGLGFGFWVSSFGFRVSGFGFPGFGFRGGLRAPRRRLRGRAPAPDAPALRR